MDWSDKRPLESLTFGLETPAGEARATVAERVRAILEDCGIKVADDVEKLGCTGLHIHGFGIDDSKFVRMGMAGSGVGLPCFVPPSRFCLVHETVGGLQDDQVQEHPDAVDDISRDLTAEERVKYEIVDRARRIKAAGDAARMDAASDMLSGRKLPPDLVDEPAAVVPTTAMRAEAHEPLPVPPRPVQDRERPWRCPEHDETEWACRYCVAAEVARGPFEPKILLVYDEGEGLDQIRPQEVEAAVGELDQRGVSPVALYVRAARFSRRLARE